MMKKVMKKTLCALLLTALVLCASPVAYARGVDRSRLRLENDIGHTVQFMFADMQMQGKLAKQSPLSEEELQQIINKVLGEMGLVEGTVGLMHDELEKAQRDGELTQKEVDQFKEDLKTMFDLANLGRVLDVLDVLLPGGNTAGGLGNIGMDVAKDRAEKIATGSLSDVGKALVKKGLKAVDVAKTLDVIRRAMTKDREKWDNRERAAELNAALNEVYSSLQQEIDKVKKEKDDKWQISFKQATAQRGNFSFFGVEANNQVWTLDMLLEQTESTGEFSFDSKNAMGTAAGTYEGKYTMTIDSNLSGFASRAQEAIEQIGIHGSVIRQIRQGDAGMEAAGVHDAKFVVELENTGTARNVRTISGSCSVYLLPSGEMQMTLGQEDDQARNEFSAIQVKLHASWLSVDQSIRLDKVQWADIKALPNENIVYVDYLHGLLTVGGEQYPDDFEISGNNGPQNGGWDDSDIWTPWDDPMKEMRIVK